MFVRMTASATATTAATTAAAAAYRGYAKYSMGKNLRSFKLFLECVLREGKSSFCNVLF